MANLIPINRVANSIEKRAGEERNQIEVRRDRNREHYEEGVRNAIQRLHNEDAADRATIKGLVEQNAQLEAECEQQRVRSSGIPAAKDDWARKIEISGAELESARNAGKNDALRVANLNQEKANQKQQIGDLNEEIRERRNTLAQIRKDAARSESKAVRSRAHQGAITFFINWVKNFESRYTRFLNSIVKPVLPTNASLTDFATLPNPTEIREKIGKYRDDIDYSASPSKVTFEVVKQMLRDTLKEFKTMARLTAAKFKVRPYPVAFLVLSFLASGGYYYSYAKKDMKAVSNPIESRETKVLPPASPN